jgi:sulfide:quinone oxidoreductase
MTISHEQEPLHVVIAGAGVAGLEAVMALRDAAGDGVRITLVSPHEHFDYVPLSVGDPFALGRARLIPLDQVARDFNVDRCVDSLASVNPSAHTLSLTSGAQLHYDKLIVAAGAKREAAYEHATTFRGQDDVEALHGLVQDVEGGYVKRIAFVVPAGVAWALPLYELALMTARRARELSLDSVELTFATPEDGPLIVFGKGASDEVGKLLQDAGIALETSVHPVVERTGEVRLVPSDRMIECDRVVALPKIRGRSIDGLPSDEDGFIPVDEHARVPGVADVYAAGDGTTFPVKQGGIACQQADTAAATIARAAGIDVPAQPFRPVLRGQLLTGEKPRFMRHELTGGRGEDSEISEETLWWPPSKIAGVHLAPFLGELPEAEQVREESQEVRLDLPVGPRITI